ncbi:MAG: serine--tRNA ligase [Candidatus Micrarchaeota archaeon]|nr:serine--tRNA ligase [Candidatus Micrarchaeota archaeon]
MLDLKLFRENPEIFYNSLKARGLDSSVLDQLKKLDLEFRAKKKELDELKHQRNELSLKINQLKKEKKEDLVKKLILQTQNLVQQIKENQESLLKIEQQMQQSLAMLPNLVHSSVPIGKDSSQNKEIKRVFSPKLFSKDVIPHYELVNLIGIDFERGAKISGSRFTVLFDELARMEWALALFMLDLAKKNGYRQVLVPYIVNQKTMYGTGQLPKFKEELYKIEGTDYWLIPTAEVPLVNLHANEILEKEQLPICYTSLTPCFRKEAGNYQKDIKGLIRQHQFHKVELVRFCQPNSSFAELEIILKHAQEVLETLQLPFRVIELCSGDLGFSSAKTYDLEVWIPSQNTYREISSCSNCTDFQARRANIKYRDGNTLAFVHTLNASALAIGRTMVAILENYQQEDGIKIPKALVPYMKTDEIKFIKKQ